MFDKIFKASEERMGIGKFGSLKYSLPDYRN